MKNEKLTIAEQLNITDFPFRIYDNNENEIYTEYGDNTWYKREYDENGNRIYLRQSGGYIENCEYSKNNILIYEKNSTHGVIFDRRHNPVTKMTIKEIEDELGINNLKIINGIKWR